MSDLGDRTEGGPFGVPDNAVGDHDINITFADSVSLIGDELATGIRDISIALYRMAAEHANQRDLDDGGAAVARLR